MLEQRNQQKNMDWFVFRDSISWSISCVYEKTLMNYVMKIYIMFYLYSSLQSKIVPLKLSAESGPWL